MKYGQGVSTFFHWDKRDFTYVYPPRNFPLPPAQVWRALLHARLSLQVLLKLCIVDRRSIEFTLLIAR